MSAEPRRLLDDPTIDRGLRETLRRASEHPPPLDPGGLTRLEAATAAGGAGAGAIVAGLAAIGLVTGGAIWLTQGAVERPPQARASREEAAPIAAPILEPSAPAPEIAPRDTAPAIAPEAVREPSALAIDRTARAPRDPAADEDALAREMSQLAMARRILWSDPARALTLLEDGRRRYRDSMFGEERAALRVLALVGLGRDLEARRAGEHFLVEHPRSPFAERVRRAIADVSR